MSEVAAFRIVLENPPPGVDFGLQKGRGTNYETIQKQRSAAGDLRFGFTAGVKAGAAPDFTGPLVQGPPGERFVYLDVGTCAGQTGTCWSRRLKIPLRGITWDMIEGPGAVLEARVNGTAKDGGPACGTVKPFGGWKST